MIFIIIKKRLNEQQGFHLAHLLPNVTIKFNIFYLISKKWNVQLWYDFGCKWPQLREQHEVNMLLHGLDYLLWKTPDPKMKS